MFNWLKKLFGKTDDKLDPAFPFPTAKKVDESHLAPYKVETPEPVKEEVKKAAPKKSRTPKKTPNKTPGSRRGRKSKAKPAE